MKSRLFMAVFDDPNAGGAKKFAKHLADALSLDQPTCVACLSKLPDVKMARTTTNEKQLIDALAGNLKADRHKIEHALAVAGFFVDALSGDSIPSSDAELWADDLQELGWIDSSSRSRFDDLLRHLREQVVPLVAPRIRERQAVSGVLPTFESFGITVEVRAIRKSTFRWGTPIQSYEPEILGTAAIASIHIGASEGMPKDLYFQADETAIDNMVASLLAAKKEMFALQEYLGLPRLGGGTER